MLENSEAMAQNLSAQIKNPNVDYSLGTDEKLTTA